MISFGSKDKSSDKISHQINILLETIKKMAEEAQSVSAISPIIPILEKIFNSPGVFQSIFNTLQNIANIIKNSSNITSTPEQADKLVLAVLDMMDHLKSRIISNDVVSAILVSLTNIGRVLGVFTNAIVNQVKTMESITWKSVFTTVQAARAALPIYFGFLAYSVSELVKAGKSIHLEDVHIVILGLIYSTIIITTIISILKFIIASKIKGEGFFTGGPVSNLTSATKALIKFIKKQIPNFIDAINKAYNDKRSKLFRDISTVKGVLIWVGTLGIVLIAIYYIQKLTIRLALLAPIVFTALPGIKLGFFALRSIIRSVLRTAKYFIKKSGQAADMIFTEKTAKSLLLGILALMVVIGVIIVMAILLTTNATFVTIATAAVPSFLIFFRIFGKLMNSINKLAARLNKFREKSVINKNTLIGLGIIIGVIVAMTIVAFIINFGSVGIHIRAALILIALAVEIWALSAFVKGATLLLKVTQGMKAEDWKKLTSSIHDMQSTVLAMFSFMRLFTKEIVGGVVSEGENKEATPQSIWSIDNAINAAKSMGAILIVLVAMIVLHWSFWAFLKAVSKANVDVTKFLETIKDTIAILTALGGVLTMLTAKEDVETGEKDEQGNPIKVKKEVYGYEKLSHAIENLSGLFGLFVGLLAFTWVIALFQKLTWGKLDIKKNAETVAELSAIIGSILGIMKLLVGDSKPAAKKEGEESSFFGDIWESNKGRLQEIVIAIGVLIALTAFMALLVLFTKALVAALKKINESKLDIKEVAKSFKPMLDIMPVVLGVAALAAPVAILGAPAILGIVFSIPIIYLVIIIMRILEKTKSFINSFVAIAPVIIMAFLQVASLFAIMIGVGMLFVALYVVLGLVDLGQIPKRKKAMAGVIEIVAFAATEIASYIDVFAVGMIASLFAGVFVLLMIIVVTGMILVGGLLYAFSKIPIDMEKTKEKVSQLLETVQYIIDAMFNFEKPGDGSNPDRSGAGVSAGLGLGTARMIAALLGAVYVILMVVAVLFMIFMGYLLQILAMMNIKEYAAGAKTNADYIIDAMDHILDMLFSGGKDKNPDNQSEDWQAKLLSWGGHFVNAIGDIIAAFLMVIKVALMIIAVILLIVMYGALLVVSKLDMSKIAGAEANAQEIMRVGKNIADLIMQKDTTEDKKTEKTWLESLIDWGKSALGTLQNIGSLVLNIGQLALMIGAIAIVAGLGKSLSAIAEFEVPTDVASQKTDGIIGTANAMIKKLNDSDIAKLDSSTEKKVNALVRMSEALGTIGENFGKAGQSADGVERVMDSYIRFLDKIDTIEITRLNTTTKMMEAWARIAEEISGDFEGLAEVMNDQIAPALEKLNETMSGVKEVQAQIIEQLELPVDTTSIEGGSGSPLLAGVPQTSSASRGGYGGSAPRPGKKYQVVFNEVKQI